jgi:hypothetical protein
MAPAIDAASESGGLLHQGEAGRRGYGVKRNQAAHFGAAAVEFTSLRYRSFGYRGKNRARSFYRTVARFVRRQADSALEAPPPLGFCPAIVEIVRTLRAISSMIKTAECEAA